MRVVAFGTASTGEGYPRLEVVLRGLELNGVHVDRVLCPLFHGHAEKMQLAGGSVTTALQVMRACGGDLLRSGAVRTRLRRPRMRCWWARSATWICSGSAACRAGIACP